MSRIALTLSGPPSALSASSERICAGTPEFRRSNRALFLGGFSTFSLLYCVQPLMPIFAREFGLSAVQSS